MSSDVAQIATDAILLNGFEWIINMRISSGAFFH
jgi:hypothetical protein